MSIGGRLFHDESGQSWLACRPVHDAFGTPIIQVLRLDETGSKAHLESIGGLTPVALPSDARGVAARVMAHWLMNPPERFLQGLEMGDLEFYPHQFRGLQAFQSNPTQRVLVADEVGTGKTIAAGYILIDYLLRQGATRIVIMAPASVKNKWRQELRRRFAQHFDTLSGKQLQTALADPTRPVMGIISQDIGASASQLLEETPPAFDLDLVIIDEAHNLIGRSGHTLRRKLGQLLCANAMGAVALTATPVQLEPHDLARVLTVIDPSVSDEVIQEAIKVHQNILAGISQESDTTLTQAFQNWSPELSGWAHQGPEESITMIEAEQTKEAKAKQAYRCSPLAAWMTRTRKSEIGLQRTRDIETIQVSFSNEERLHGPTDARVRISPQGLATTIDALFKHHFSYTHRMQLASSWSAVATALENGSKGHIGSAWRTELAALGYTSQEAKLDQETQQTCQTLRSQLSYAGSSPKAKALEEIIEDLNARRCKKIIVFTQWLDTLGEIASALEALQVPHAVVNGSMDEPQKRRAIERMQDAPERFVLVTTDTLAEGVDLFQASGLVNYDLPVNPQLLEQRIGRIDRIGQQSQTVWIRNLILEGTVEERIHEILVDRINAFGDTLGGLEDILASAIEESSEIDDAIREVERARELAMLTDETCQVPQAARGESPKLVIEETTIAAWARSALSLLQLSNLPPTYLAEAIAELTNTSNAPQVRESIKAAASANGHEGVIQMIVREPLGPVATAIAAAIASQPHQECLSPGVQIQHVHSAAIGRAYMPIAVSAQGQESDPYEIVSAAIKGQPLETNTPLQITPQQWLLQTGERTRNEQIFRLKRKLAINSQKARTQPHDEGLQQETSKLQTELKTLQDNWIAPSPSTTIIANFPLD